MYQIPICYSFWDFNIISKYLIYTIAQYILYSSTILSSPCSLKSPLPFSARFNSTVSSRGSIHGLSLLSLFIHKYLADTSFTTISCRVTNTDLVSGCTQYYSTVLHVQMYIQYTQYIHYTQYLFIYIIIMFFLYYRYFSMVVLSPVSKANTSLSF